MIKNPVHLVKVYSSVALLGLYQHWCSMNLGTGWAGKNPPSALFISQVNQILECICGSCLEEPTCDIINL